MRAPIKHVAFVHSTMLSIDRLARSFDALRCVYRATRCADDDKHATTGRPRLVRTCSHRLLTNSLNQACQSADYNVRKRAVHRASRMAACSPDDYSPLYLISNAFGAPQLHGEAFAGRQTHSSQRRNVPSRSSGDCHRTRFTAEAQGTPDGRQTASVISQKQTG